MSLYLKPKNVALHTALSRRMTRRNVMVGAALGTAAVSMKLAAQGDNTLAPTPAPTATVPAAAPTEAPAQPTAAPTTPPTPTEAPATISAEDQASAQTTEEFPSEGVRINEGLLPDYRLIMYYGFPQVPQMGILGEHEPEELLGLLQNQMAEYQAVINDRPWKMGIELIASVAQRDPGPDGKYVADTDGKWLDLYTEFTAANDMYLLLDVQCGLKTPFEDYVGLERWLANDHVHLAIDPEFHVLPGEVPGLELGSIDAADIKTAQEWLLGLSNKYKTSRKMLLVHQFNVYSISNKDQVKPMNGVDLVLNMDGFGTPEMKLDTWSVIIQQQPIEYNGIKIFYNDDNDYPKMSPADVMALTPTPDVINYQ